MHPYADSLSAPEIVMLIEALDALIPAPEGTGHWSKASQDDSQRWEPYRLLRSRLKQVVHMSFYDNAGTWLDEELRRERIALAETLQTRLAELLKEPGASRNSIRAGFVEAVREVKEARQSEPKPLS